MRKFRFVLLLTDNPLIYIVGCSPIPYDSLKRAICPLFPEEGGLVRGKNIPGIKAINRDYLKDLTRKILRIPSPSGTEKEISNFLHSELGNVVIDAEMAICCEPTNLRIGIGNKGAVPIRLLTKGKATHGRMPDAGVNAIYNMRHVLEAFERNWKVNEREVEGIGKTFGTYNVGMIEGGDNFLVVPDWCNIWIDRRTIPGETKEHVRREVDDFLNPIGDRDPSFQYEVFINERPDWKWPKIIERGIKSVIVSSKEEVVGLASSAYRKQVG